MTFKEDKGLFLNKLELSFFPVDDKGKPLKGTTSELDLKLKPNTLSDDPGLRLPREPAHRSAAGRYQVRIGARESGAGEVGSVFYRSRRPRLREEKLTMSDVLLTAATSKLVMTPLPDKLAEGVLPLPATARRDFVKGDTLALFAEVYDNLPPLPAHKIDVTTKLITEDGREVFKTSEERASKDLGGTKRRRLRPRAPDPARRRRARPLLAAHRSGGAVEGCRSGGEGAADSRASGTPGAGRPAGRRPAIGCACGRRQRRSPARRRPPRRSRGGSIKLTAQAATEPDEISSTGLPPRVAGLLCYAAAWASGLLLVAIERDSRFVRFHAWQSLLGFGALTLLALAAWGVTLLMAFVSPAAFRVMAYVAQIAWIALGAAWILAVVMVAQGRRWKMPLVGKWAGALCRLTGAPG